MDIEDGIALPQSPVSVSVTLRGHTVLQDKPAASGGGDKGPMASELLLASLLACQHSTFVKVAAKRKVDAAIRELRGELHFVSGDIVSAKVRFLLDARAQDPPALATVLRLTDKACTISRVLKVPVETSYELFRDSSK